VDRASRRTVAWVVGGRDAATFQRLYDKVKHLTDCIFYTDDWKAFANVLPPERHVIGKAHTIMIEQDNGNTRHHLGRMTRRTKVVSKKEEIWSTPPSSFGAPSRSRKPSPRSRNQRYLSLGKYSLVFNFRIQAKFTLPKGCSSLLRWEEVHSAKIFCNDCVFWPLKASKKKARF